MADQFRRVVQRMPSGPLRDLAAAAIRAIFNHDVKALPDVQRASPSVIVLLGRNPGAMTLHGTNTYLLGTSASRILVDTGSSGESSALFTAQLRRVLEREGAIIQSIILTHWHTDHTGGVDTVLRLLARTQGTPPTLFKHAHSEASVPLPVAIRQGAATFEPLVDGQVFEVPGASLRVVHTPGHTTDSICLWHESEASLFTGDCVLGAGSCVFSDLAAYMTSLGKLEVLSPSRLYCGHGPPVGPLPPSVAEELQRIMTGSSQQPSPWQCSAARRPLAAPARPDTSVDGTGKIRAYILHRLDREAQVVAVLQAEHAPQLAPPPPPPPSLPLPLPGLTALQVTERMYAREGLPPLLLRAASHVVSLHLQKLLQDGVVDVVGGSPPSTAPTDDAEGEHGGDSAGAGVGQTGAAPRYCLRPRAALSAPPS